MNHFCRADVLRICTSRPTSWLAGKKQGVSTSDTFTFFDLLQLTKVRDLRAKRVRPAAIRESLQAMLKQVAGMEEPAPRSQRLQRWLARGLPPSGAGTY